jgi:hypothetical protein
MSVDDILKFHENLSMFMSNVSALKKGGFTVSVSSWFPSYLWQVISFPEVLESS